MNDTFGFIDGITKITMNCKGNTMVRYFINKCMKGFEEIYPSAKVISSEYITDRKEIERIYRNKPTTWLRQAKLLSSWGINNLCIELKYDEYKIISHKDNYTDVVKCKINFCPLCGRKLEK